MRECPRNSTVNVFYVLLVDTSAKLIVSLPAFGKMRFVNITAQDVMSNSCCILIVQSLLGFPVMPVLLSKSLPKVRLKFLQNDYCT